MGAPEGLQERGRALWEALGLDVASPAGAVALEACRIADRLDELDRVIAGKGVLNLMSFRLDLDLEHESGDREVRVRVEFSHVLAEARQQAATFTALVSKLGLDKAPAKPAGDGEASPLAQVLDFVRAGAQSSGGPG